MTHTKGPWRATMYSGVFGCAIMAQPDPAENSVLVASVAGERNIADANARRIVRAVNAHDDLVATIHEIAAMRWSVQSGDATARDMRGRARSALRRIGRAKATRENA